MKNQIILVSRVYQRDEFKYYNSDNDDPVSVENENTKVIILQGFSYFKNEPESDEEFEKWGKDEAVKILKESENKKFKKDGRTVIAYHDRTDREDEFKLAIEQEKWSAVEKIAKYSAKGKEEVTDIPLYRDILVPLGDAIKKKKDTAKLIDALWLFFFDIILEEKLIHLQKAANGELDVKTLKLPEPIQEFKSDFEKFLAVEEVKNKDVFSASGKFQDAYATLREALKV